MIVVETRLPGTLSKPKCKIKKVSHKKFLIFYFLKKENYGMDADQAQSKKIVIVQNEC